MKIVADLHLHSKYSRATSPQMDLENLDKWAQLKGITILGTADFTHPLWLSYLKEKLEPAESGLLRLKGSKSEARFILSAEISCIYSKNNKVRKIHIVILAPSFKVVEKINTHLGWIGNLKADGRPILGLDAKELVKIVLNSSPDCLIIPAHVWTPWFSLFGSKSGFDSMEECFENYSKNIFAVETGLSSNPPMNWRLTSLDKIALVSNSDAHSPPKIGREANVFDTELTYSAIMDAIRSKDPHKFLYTIEFFPQEGKYHYDGHRSCNVALSPKETERYSGICPVCGKPLTIGVLNRINKLADRGEESKPENPIPFKSLIPLGEIIGEALGVAPNTKQVEKEYKNLINTFGNELRVLIEIPRESLEKATFPEVVEGIIKVRDGKVNIEPGYDGVYGKIRIFSQGEKKFLSKQKSLF